MVARESRLSWRELQPGLSQFGLAEVEDLVSENRPGLWRVIQELPMEAVRQR